MDIKDPIFNLFKCNICMGREAQRIELTGNARPAPTIIASPFI